MKRLDDRTNVLGFCAACFRVRWLRLVREPGDRGYDENMHPAGTCRQCEREDADG